VPLRLPLLSVAAALLLAPGLARTETYELVGEVVDAVPALASYGVTPGAEVDVSWTVDLSTPASNASGPPDNKTDYAEALDFLVIQIGTWTAVRVVPPMGQIDQGIVSVADDSGGSLDLLHVATPGTDNDLVLHGPAMGGVLVLSLDFYAPNGGASSNQSLDQDPSLYPIGFGSAIGANGYVTFTLAEGGGGGGGGSGNPTATCDSAQLGAGGRLCSSQLRCRSSHAKAPDAGALEDCLDEAGETFTAAYSDALVSAAERGLTCSTTAPAFDQRVATTERVEEIVDDVDAIAPAHAPLAAAWLGAAGSACGAALKAAASNAAKPDAGKLAQARDKARAKLEGSAGKAIAKATKRGVVFAPPLDAGAFADAVDARIDGIAEDLGGD
jgi:hypothetical protein